MNAQSKVIIRILQIQALDTHSLCELLVPVNDLVIIKVGLSLADV